MQPYAERLRRNLQEWPIRKFLTASDVGHLSRLVLPRAKVQECIFRFWDKNMVEMFNRGHSREVIMRDVDTNSSIDMVFRRWKNNKMYVLQLNWTKEFIVRRRLREGDEIGMAWDQTHQCLLFSMLNRRELLQLRLALTLPQQNQHVLRPNAIRLVAPWKEWPITKILTASDVGHLSKLALSRKQVQDYIFPFWDDDIIRMVNHGGICINVVIKDVDTRGSTHKMIFGRLINDEVYVIQSNWTKEFVERRRLQEGDEIGIVWDKTIQCFLFSVLSHRHLDLNFHL